MKKFVEKDVAENPCLLYTSQVNDFFVGPSNFIPYI